MDTLIGGRIAEEEHTDLKLDKRDKQILHILSENARMPYSTIAKKVRLSRETVQYRVKRLLSNKIILNFIPRIDLSYFGYQTFHVFMIINSLNKKKKTELLQRLDKHPHTVRVMEYHASWDLEWVLIAKSIQSFDEIINEVTHEYSDIIARKDELTIIKDYKAVYLPGIVHHDPKEISPKKEIKQCIDDLDLKLLTLLRKNARATTYELAEKLKTSHDTVQYRMKRMQECGIIKGYTTIVNLSAMNQHWYTFCINVKAFSKEIDSKFKELIFQNPHVLRAIKVLGDWDLLVYSVVDSPIAFHDTFKSIHDNFIDVISHYETWNAYKEHSFHAIPKILLESKPTDS